MPAVFHICDSEVVKKRHFSSLTYKLYLPLTSKTSYLALRDGVFSLSRMSCANYPVAIIHVDIIVNLQKMLFTEGDQPIALLHIVRYSFNF